MAMQNGQRRLKLMQGVVNNRTAKRDRTNVTKTPSTQVTPENVKKGATSDDLQPRALDFSSAAGLGFYMGYITWVYQVVVRTVVLPC